MAHMVTVDGEDSGGKGMTAQICKVHRTLMSVKKICKNGQRVVFDEEGSDIESKNIREKLKIIVEDGEYLLDVWVKVGEGKDSGFGGQGK